MARNSLPYSVEGSLGRYLSLHQAKLITEQGGIKINMRDVEQELADYCYVTRDTIAMIKRGINQPSLPLALRIGQFFGVTVEEIFTIKEGEEENGSSETGEE